MSGFQYQGRRVADPRPVVRGELGNDAHHADELETAWERMTKAKSALKRAEFRANEAEKPKGSYLSGNQLGEFISRDLTNEKVKGYRVMDPPSGSESELKLDKYGRTSHMKSRQDRKIVRLEDRYQEKDSRQRSPLREPNQLSGNKRTLDTGTTSGTELPGNYHFSYDVESHRNPRHASSSTETSRDVTSSTAVRETNINFPNDLSVHATRQSQTHPTRVHHVAVRVPSGQKPSSLLTGKNVPVRHVTTIESGRAASDAHKKHANGVRKSESVSSAASSQNTDTTYTINEQNQWKARKTLKDLALKSEGLDKVRELIKQQRKFISTTDGGMAAKKLHHDEEEVAPKQYDIYEADKPAPQRKVATGPPLPTYKGFNATETRYQLRDGRIVSDAAKQKKKAKKERIVAKAREEAAHQVDDPKITRNEHALSPDKPRKIAKMSTEEKRPSKFQAHKDIITTSSWRAGQKLVMKELGPSRHSRAPDSPPTRDNHRHAEEADSLSEANIHAHNARTDVQSSSSGLRKPKSHTLSKQAQDVLADLEDGNEMNDDKDAGEHAAKRPKLPPRKPLSKDNNKTKHISKVKHYDSSDVRQYIRRQKMERKKKEHDEKEARKHAEEAKQKQLEELYRKQQDAARAKSRAKQEGSDGYEHKGDSDKENKSGSEMSCDSGTLSDRSGYVEHADHQREQPPAAATHADRRSRGLPVPKQTLPSEHMETANKMIAKYVADQAMTNADPVPAVSGKLSAADVLRQFTTETGMTSEEAVHQFAAKTKPQYRPAPDIPDANHTSSLPPKYGEMEHGRPLSASTGTNYRTRAERINSLCNTATSLTSRLQLESQRLAKEIGPDKWAHPRLTEEEDEYVGRYQKISGRKTDSVFSSDLPGVGSLARVEEQQNKTDAATKIQAAYRGHTVRQTFDWRPPEYKSSHLDESAHKQFSDDDFSDMTGSTLTEDSFADKNEQLQGRLRPSKPIPKWTAPQGDPYSVMNVFSRKQRNVTTARDVAEYGDPEAEMRSHHARSAASRSPSALSATDDYKSDFETGRSLSYQSERSGSQRGYLSEGSRARAQHTEASRTDRTSRADRRRQASHASSGDGKKRSDISDDCYSKDDEDTLDGTLTPPSLASDDDKKSLVPSQRSALRAPAGDESDMSAMSGQTEEHSVPDPLVHNMPPRSSAGATGYGAPRMAPAALSSRMAMELNLLESMEESVRQLTEVERSRAVSMAQQETVSLAQILKARQQTHNRDMDELQLEVERDKLAARSELEEARRQASTAAQDAANAIAQVRGESSSSMQQASQQLIETQMKATKATADIAKTLAEAKASLAPRYDVTQDAVTRAATAAARAAVEATLKQYRHIPSKVSRGERGTQYSQRSAGPATHDSEATRTNGTETSRTEASQSYASDSFEESYTPDPSDPSSKYLDLGRDKRTKRNQSEASEVGTASDLSPRRADDSLQTNSVATESGQKAKPLSSGEPSSIATESIIRPHSPGSKTESVAEEIISDLDDKDDTQDFDSSVAEELEQSIRDVIPDRSVIKRCGNQSESIGDEASTTLPSIPSPSNVRRLSFEDSFAKFTVDMVKQYMREEETRASHQNTLLKLREQALKEKVKAELAWIGQQKQRVRKKGEDDHYPILKKKERGLRKRLQQEQAEIKRLQEANRAASKERQMLLLQSQEIARLRQSTQEIKKKLKDSPKDPSAYDITSHGGMDVFWNSDMSVTDSESTSYAEEVRLKIKKKGGDPPSAVSLVSNEVPTEDEISLHTDDGDSYLSKPGADDSELGRPASPDREAFRNLKKMKLDEKFLTVREQRLRERKRKLQEWNDRLDKEEAEIERLEKKAGKSRKDRSMRPLEQAVGKDTLQLTPRTPRGGDRSYATTIDESIATETSIGHEKPSESGRSRTQRSITEELSTALSSQTTARSRRRTVSDSSIPEEVSEESEIHTETRTRKTHDTSPDDTGVNTSGNESYSNETFETETVHTTQARSAVSVSASVPKSERTEVTKDGGLDSRPPKSLPKAAASPATRKSSGSESDEPMPETASDQSDVEGRIRALGDALRNKKLEAERLKKEQKKKNRDKLREQEEKLKKQIDAYDSYINQVKIEMNGEQEVDQKSPIRPQIKQPSETRHRRGEEGERAERKPDVSIEDSPSATGSSPIATGPNDTIRQQQSPSPLRHSYLTAMETEQKKTSTPIKPTEDQSEMSEDIADEAPSTAYSETYPSGKNELKLKLDDDKEASGKDVVTPREDTNRDRDTARSMSEIAEEVTSQTPRSEAGDEDSAKLKLDLGKEERMPDSARSAYTEGSLSARSDSEKITSARSDYSEEYEASTHSDRTDTESRSDSRSYTKSYTTTRSESSTLESKSRKSDKTKSKDARTTSGKEESIKESLSTEEDITEEFAGDDEEEDQPLFDLNLEQPATPAETEIHLQPVPVKEDPLRDFCVGDRVVVGGVQPGTLRFKGYTKFADGVWGGVELDRAEGSNDGSKDGTVYFICPPRRGLFVPPDKLSTEPAVGAGTDGGVESDARVTEDEQPPKSTNEEVTATSKKAAEAVSEEEAKKKEELVETITDGLTALVVKDSLDAVSNIGAKDELDNEASSKGDKPKKVVKEGKVDSATEQTMNNMLNEAISQMITIRQQKQDKIGSPESEPEDIKDSMDKMRKIGGVENESEVKITEDSKEKEKPKSHFDLGDTASLITGRPSSPEPSQNNQSGLDDLYRELETMTGDSFAEEWMDDDFGLGMKKPPPPYSEKGEKGAFGRGELQLDLQKLSQDLYFAVPHSEEEVVPLVDEVIDVFWDMRRCGESWEDVTMPDTFFSSDDKTRDMDGKSKHSFKSLVFDLTAEILREMYKGEEEVECPVWQKPPSIKRRFHKAKSPPNVVTDLKPIVQECVLDVLQVENKAQQQKGGKKWGGGRKKKDRVDQILVSELREEEPDWINYDHDELAVKMQLADTLFESLLGETTRLFSAISQKKAAGSD